MDMSYINESIYDTLPGDKEWTELKTVAMKKEACKINAIMIIIPQEIIKPQKHMM